MGLIARVGAVWALTHAGACCITTILRDSITGLSYMVWAVGCNVICCARVCACMGAYTLPYVMSVTHSLLHTAAIVIVTPAPVPQPHSRSKGAFTPRLIASEYHVAGSLRISHIRSRITRATAYVHSMVSPGYRVSRTKALSL